MGSPDESSERVVPRRDPSYQGQGHEHGLRRLHSANPAHRNHPRHLHHQGRLGSHELGDDELEDETDSEQQQEGAGDKKQSVLLHGKLEVGIGNAQKLSTGGPVASCMRLPVATCSGGGSNGEKGHKRRGVYVVMSLGGARLIRTRVAHKPAWKEEFVVHVAHFVTEVVFSVKAEGLLLGPRLLGRVRIPAAEVLSEKAIEGWFPISGWKNSLQEAQINLHVKFIAADKDPNYTGGVDHRGVENVYFPLREGCRVVLYQDAHADIAPAKPIKLDGDRVFERARCWEDLCRAIVDAHHIVYIVGWAVYDKIKLVRHGNKELPDVTLGELLKMKASEGVRVLLLIWDDKTSHQTRFFKIAGVMGTHDEETKKFFKHSAVKCVLAPRYGDNKLTWFRQKIVGTLFTHHQKMVIVDTQGPGQTRKLTAFLGGLDLCDGRYDTPEHSIFNSLTSVHKDDCYNAMFTASPETGGPRQPWHDQHCMIEGPAAYDCLTNFEQRWLKSTKWHEDALVHISRISWILGPIKENSENKDLLVTKSDDPETWHTQIFRSIDSGSVRDFPTSVYLAKEKHLVWGKNISIDRSIHTAYVERIRSAQHFIYIENQYFLGSSYAWPDYKNAGAIHLIPMELALKVAAKIKAHERFAVYVVIPMYPEGGSFSASGQEILYFQAQTMEMMYRVIASALSEAGLSEKFHPQDYLNFYCLGNREVREQTPENPPSEKSKQHATQQSSRFLIYVHAKSMIVDDEFVTIGSANINQRSMDGCRDTEIAMGAYQPNYTWINLQKHPRGQVEKTVKSHLYNCLLSSLQVYGHRMSLWAEHLACVEDCFDDPASLETVHKVNRLARENWDNYVSEEPVEMKGHLMPYPVQVTKEGKLEPMAGFETFPDVGGKVLGTPHGNLPDELTS